MPKLQIEIEIGKIIFIIIFIGYKYVFINLYIDFANIGKGRQYRKVGKFIQRQGSLQKGRKIYRKVQKFTERQGSLQKGKEVNRKVVKAIEKQGSIKKGR